MLIACRFKRPKAPVDLGDRVYFFTPVDPSNPDSEHVAVVEDNVHVQKLLAVPEAYYIATSEPPAAPQLAAKPQAIALSNQPSSTGAAQTAADEGAGKPGTEAAGGGDAQLPAELIEAATNLNGLSWQALQAKLKEGGIDKVVIKAALDIELAKPEADQRATTIKLLTKAIEG